MNTGTKTNKLVNQEQALSNYFDAMLFEQTQVATPVESAALTATAAALEEPRAPAVDGMAMTEPPAANEDWKAGRFQAQLFEVAGLTLAVPLAKLAGVIDGQQGMAPIQESSSLLIGRIDYRGAQSPVVDTARFVLPQDRAALLDDNFGDRADHLVIIDGGRWALACSHIGEVVDLEPGDVKWRSQAGKRLWLAGTLLARRCALLDVDELSRELGEGMA